VCDQNNQGATIVTSYLSQGSSGSVSNGEFVMENDDYKSGVVKWFSTDKAYGFISVDDGSFDVFVHAKQLKASGINKALKEGEKLRFRTEEGRKGQFAVDISFIVSAA
jgi:CspA family cold shock protein